MNTMPVTVRRSIEILGLCALIGIVYLGQSIIMPLLTAFFIALLLLPLLRFLLRYRIPEVLAIVICIIVFALVIIGITAFLSFQVGSFLSDLEAIQANLTIHWNKLSGWISQKMHFTVDEQLAMIQKQGSNLGNNISTYLQGALVSITSIFVFLGLLPIYLFLILFYRKLLLRFVYLWFEEAEHEKVKETVVETEVIVKYYLVGLMIQIAYLTVLLGATLFFFGIKHALLIAVTFAILNLIPYVGALIGNLIGVILTLTSSQELWQIWAVLGSIAVVQFLDNNILMPRIVGSRVKINALASIVGIVIGGTIAGVAGMFLSIPLMAVMKIVFDKSIALKQWGYLLGDERPAHSPMSNRMFRVNRDKLGEKLHNDKEE